jgi:WD40 repeat protein
MGFIAAVSVFLGIPFQVIAPGAPNDDEEPSIPGLPAGALARLESTAYWHEAPVISAVIPPDRKRLICLDAEGFLTGWDRSTRKPLYHLQVTDRGHRDRRIGCSPGGTWILLSVKVRSAPTVTVFRLTTGDEECRIERCSGAVFSSGDKILTAWHCGQVRRWDLDSGNELARPQASPLEILSLDVSPDGGVIAAAVAGWGDPMIWNGWTGKRLYTPNAILVQATGVAVSLDGRTILAGNQWCVSSWNVTKEGALPGRVYEVYGGPRLRFSSDGRRLVGSLRPKRIGVWNVEQMEAVTTYWYPSTVYGFFEVSAQADEVIHARGPWVQIEPVTPSENEPMALPPAASVDFVTFTLEAKGVTCEPTGAVRFWEPTSGRLIRTEEVGPFVHLVLSRDSVKAAILEKESTLRVWDFARRIEVMKLEKLNHVTSIAWSPDGKFLAVGSYGKFISVWGVPDRKDILRIPTEGIAVGAIAWSPDGKSIAWGEPSGAVAFAEVRRGIEQTRYHPRGGPITAILFLPGGTSVVTGDGTGAVRRWDDVPQKEPSLIGRHKSAVSALAISPDGLWIASGDAYGWVFLWPAMGGPAIPMDPEQTSRVSSLAFSVDGGLLIAGGTGFGGIVWKVPEGK